MEILHGFDGALGGAPRLLANGGNGRRDVFHVPFDPVEDDVVEVVVRSVAVIHNAEPEELPPLAEAVDPDALSSIVRSDGEPTPPDAKVTFVFENLEITVSADGDLWLEWL